MITIAVIWSILILIFSFLFLSSIYLVWKLVLNGFLSMFERLFLGVFLSLVAFVSFYFVYSLFMIM
jgi:hypothetical protein